MFIRFTATYCQTIGNSSIAKDLISLTIKTSVNWGSNYGATLFKTYKDVAHAISSSSSCAN